ncbi:hypothetical protein GCM10023069_31240 [Shinella granuli]
METIVMGQPRRIAFYPQMRAAKKLRVPPDSKGVKGSLNRAPRFLCDFGPALRKTIERAGKACLS